MLYYVGVFQPTLAVLFRSRDRQEPLDIVNMLTDGEARGYSIAIVIGAGFDPQTMEIEIIAFGQQT